ncbi:uncharacterized protein LOC128860144 [Anastrepha ludens]|uniref:uncharacterized protein LOC128860144 n=1 Tax=Anastrepha ludens TaxID=28586 RepID=UPI0023B11C0F|nr:uncharacterized protein LOC128860144 [Anastrepha ludens]
MSSFVTGESINSYKLARFSRPIRYNDPIVHGKQEQCYTIRKPLVDYIRDDLHEQSRRLFYQRVFIVAKNNMKVEPPTPPPLQSGRSSQSLPSMRMEPADFKMFFQLELQRILTRYAEENVLGVKPTGFFLYMGEYSLLFIECAEDSVGSFCAHLSALADRYFLANKVFLTEDRTAETYFQTFHCRRAASININEKFPAHTTTDVELMSQQHLTIKQKLYALCEALDEKVKRELETVSLKGSVNAKVALSLVKPTIDTEELLPAAIFNKLLPEVQRIELVLSCNRFYCNVQRRALMYKSIPAELEANLLTWPIPYNYTPLGVFRHSPYDVNLTFTDHGKKEENEKEKGSDSEGSEQKG